MERLLSTAMHRRVSLLNVLNGSNGWITSDKVAELVGCSPKSVMLDCQYIEDRWPDYVSIETSRKHGIHLIESPHYSIHDIYIEIIKESSAFTLLESIFFKPKQSAEFWQEKLYLSHSSLYRLSNLIASALKERQLEINRSPYCIHGKDERQVRYFFTSYFLEVYGIREWPFHLEKDKVLSLAQKINQSFNLKLNDIQMVHLAYSIAVTIIREHQGVLIKSKKDPMNLFAERTMDVKKYRKDVEEIAKPLNAVVPDNWYEDFCYSIFWWDFGWDNRQERTNVVHHGNELVNTVKNALEIPISETSREKIVQLVEYTYAKHKMFPFKKYMVYDRFLYSSKAIKQTYIVFTAVVLKALNTWEDRTKFPWKSMYINEMLHEIAIRWDDLPQLLERLRHQVSILVLSDLGSEHGKLLASILKDNFHHKVTVAIEEHPIFEQTKTFDFNKYDLYVSNYTLRNVSEKNNIIVDDIPSFKNLTDLRKFIDTRRVVIPDHITYLKK